MCEARSGKKGHARTCQDTPGHARTRQVKPGRTRALRCAGRPRPPAELFAAPCRGCWAGQRPWPQGGGVPVGRSGPRGGGCQRVRDPGGRSHMSDRHRRSLGLLCTNVTPTVTVVRGQTGFPQENGASHVTVLRRLLCLVVHTGARHLLCHSGLSLNALKRPCGPWLWAQNWGGAGTGVMGVARAELGSAFSPM